MLFDDPVPEPLVPRVPHADPVQAVDQMLRRALRVGPDAPTGGAEPDTWAAATPRASDFWHDGPPRARSWRARLAWPRVGRRARMLAALTLVGGLAVGWIATSRAGGARPRAEPTRPPASSAPTTAAAAHAVAAGRSLRAIVPPGATCGFGPRTASEAHCSVGSVEVDYRLLEPGELSAAYLAAAGSPSGAGRGAGAGAPACARGAEEEHSWSRPAAPRRAVGRYACRIEQGRAAMWWTVDDRGLLAHATSPNADLASLFAWWDSHAER